jgi:hypothetical protein
MPAAQQAMQDVFNKIAQKGYAWADGHGGNVRFVSDGVGGLKAVVIDPDFVMTPQEYAASIRDGSMPGRVLGGKLFATEGLQDWADLQKGKQVSAQQLSDSLFQAQFGEPDILPRVTNGVTVPRK